MATQAERRAATTAALLQAATALFGEHGYDATSIDQVAAAAGVTKGALYHHFPGGKEALFRRVFEEAEVRLATACAEAGAAAGPDPLEALRAASRTFLESCRDPATRRLVLVDGPAVLGWETWREVDERYFLGGVRLALRTAMDQRRLRDRPVDPLAHLLMGALTEAAMTVARADDPDAALRDVLDEVDELLRGLS